MLISEPGNGLAYAECKIDRPDLFAGCVEIAVVLDFLRGLFSQPDKVGVGSVGPPRGILRKDDVALAIHLDLHSYFTFFLGRIIDSGTLLHCPAPKG